MKHLIRVGFVSIVALLSYSSAQETSWTCPEGFAGQELSVYNWTTYVAEDTISNFEQLCDVTVVYDTFPTDGDMLARIRQGNPGYDVTFPGTSTLPLMITEGLVEPLDKANIPNFVNLEPTLLDTASDPENEYSVPYQWGTVGIGYNKTNVGKDITSWNDMFDYEGPVSWLEDVRAVIGTALLMLGKDPNSSNEEDINAARDYLIGKGKNVTYINQDDGQEVLARGEVDMTSEYMGDIFQIMADCACEDYAYVIPSEGALFWFDSIVIPVGAPNKALAEVFIDYILDPQVGADISNYTAFASPNKAAVDQKLIDAALLDNPGIYPPADVMAKLFSTKQDADSEYLYNNAWEEVKIALGQ
jgi:spermidine/putrescine transport system substrate-binding protein